MTQINRARFRERLFAARLFFASLPIAQKHGEALPLRAKPATQRIENGRTGPLSEDQPCLRQIAAMHNFSLLNRGE